jgi:hypothetical protein
MSNGDWAMTQVSVDLMKSFASLTLTKSGGAGQDQTIVVTIAVAEVTATLGSITMDRLKALAKQALTAAANAL